MIRKEIISLGVAAFTASVCYADKPNLLIIHTDEHNFRTLGCYRDTLSPEQAFMWGKGNIVESEACRLVTT